jgi:putative ABC transport system permease protein
VPCRAVLFNTKCVHSDCGRTLFWGYPMTTDSSSGRDVHVQRLVALPFMKSVEISFKSIKVRFFRSLITTLSLVLAVSFLSYVQIDNTIANGLLNLNNPQINVLMEKAGYDIPEQDSSIGSSPKQRWIVILSLLVCVVGIVNAQLMSVTERFREIGTMKCLGALDRFIIRLFLLEAAMQGFAGSAVGSLIGALFAIGGGLLRFGTTSVGALVWGDVLASLLMAIATGCLLSLVGVIYPAIVAARMQPVEAMRSDN